MSEKFRSEQELVNALGGLPRSKAPASDLWPGISDRLEPQEMAVTKRVQGWRAPALAASIAVAFAAGILLGRQAPVQPLPGEMGSERLSGTAMQAAMMATELEYQAAFKSLAPVGIAPAMFETGDIESIEGSWTALQLAETALLTALQDHPDNPYLGEKLMDLRAQQLEFMKQLHMLDQNSRRKT